MYRYTSDSITTDELKSFALGGYAEADAEDIPPVKSELWVFDIHTFIIKMLFNDCFLFEINLFCITSEYNYL